MPAILATSFNQAVLNIKGKPFTYWKRPYLYDIVNHPHRPIVLRTGRQSEKSTTVGNRLLFNCSLNREWASLYISPTSIQTKRFSKQRLGDPIATSPWFQKHMIPRGKKTSVFEKNFSNLSRIELSYTWQNADRTRGISADELVADEIQDIEPESIPIVMESISHSDFAISSFCGTPKTFETSLEYYFNMSIQHFWFVKCDKCGRWQTMEIENIGIDVVRYQNTMTGLICSKCKNPINPAKGSWVQKNNQGSYYGYHIPQIMVPIHYTEPVKWKELHLKLDKYPEAKFKNEVMGVPFDHSVKPLTIEDLLACCREDKKMCFDPSEIQIRWHTYAGIDWGMNLPGNSSTTVLTIIQRIGDDLYDVLFQYRYEGAEASPEFFINDMAMKLNKFGCQLAGVDFGLAFGFIERLRSLYPSNRVIAFQMGTGVRSGYMANIGAGSMQVNKPEAVSRTINLIKKKKVIFPSESSMKEFLNDYLAICYDINRRGDLRYTKVPSVPDDSFYSLTNAILASDFVNPNKYRAMMGDKTGWNNIQTPKIYHRK